MSDFPDQPPSVDELLNRPAKDPRGSVAKGVWLNISFNLLTCLLWLPFCGLEMLLTGGEGDMTITQTLLFAVVYIGFIQYLHVFPLGFKLYSNGQSKTLTGMIYASLVTLVIWLFLFVSDASSM